MQSEGSTVSQHLLLCVYIDASVTGQWSLLCFLDNADRVLGNSCISVLASQILWYSIFLILFDLLFSCAVEILNC